MGFIDLPSGNSLWRGYDYFKENRVFDLHQLDETTYESKVKGSGKKIYSVVIDITHPRKSKCSCPHANGRRIICKHMVAAYFAAFPEEAKRIYEEMIAYQIEEEKRQEELENNLIDFIHKMKKSELEAALLQILFDGPEWQYNNFLRDHMGEW